MTLLQRLPRLLSALAGVVAITWIGYARTPVNATTAGFAYLLFVLAIASTWGFLEAAISSIAAALAFNFFFFEPKLTFTINDPANWVAFLSFLTTSLVASRLSTEARRRAADALDRQRDLERLYTFGRWILLTDDNDAFPKQLAQRLAEVFELDAVALYEMGSGEIHRAGPADFDGMDSQIREAALQGTTFTDTNRNRIITGVRLGSTPVASLALQCPHMPDSVLQSIANLVAIGLERAKAQEVARQTEVSRRSEQLRTTLIDAMAHEFKTPLTSIRAATSAFASGADLNTDSAHRIWRIADEEAAHLEELIDSALDVARLETEDVDVDLEVSDLEQVVLQVIDALKGAAGDRKILFECSKPLQPVAIDRRLTKLVLRQVLSNALKYSPQDTPVILRMGSTHDTVGLDIIDRGKGIPEQEQNRIFERFYRSPSVKDRIPGSGLGLSIARRIMETHKGSLTVQSRPGETKFRIELPTAKELP